MHFEGSDTRLDRIAGQTQKLGEGQRRHIEERIKLLRRWERTGKRVLPFVLKMLGSD